MKRLIAFFKEPPAWFALLWVLLTGGMIVLSAAVSSSGAKEEPFAAVLYGFTALSLSYAIYAIVRWVPKVKLAAKTRLSRNKYAGTFLASYTVRTVVYSSLSTLLDFAYVVVNGVTAIRYHSVWYYALAAYYFALMVIRLFVILCAGQGLKKYGSESRAFDERKLNIYLISGVALLLLEASLSGVITLMIALPKETQTGFVLAIANAAYTFTRVILAIVNKVKSGKRQEPVTQALRNLNLTDALVSLFSLQITLSAAVGGDLPLQMNGLVGFAVCFFTACLGIYMIFDGVRRKKKLGRLCAAPAAPSERDAATAEAPAPETEPSEPPGPEAEPSNPPTPEDALSHPEKSKK